MVKYTKMDFGQLFISTVISRRAVDNTEVDDTDVPLKELAYSKLFQMWQHFETKSSFRGVEWGVIVKKQRLKTGRYSFLAALQPRLHQCHVNDGINNTICIHIVGMLDR